MNIELTPEQIEFVERAIASGQYGSVEEVSAQIVAIGIREIEKQIALETELLRLRAFREMNMVQLALVISGRSSISQVFEEYPKKLDPSTVAWKISDENDTDEQREFLEKLNDSKRRSERLWDILDIQFTKKLRRRT